MGGRFASMRHRTRDGPKERTRGDRKCHPEDQLWDETDHQVLAPKTRRTRIPRGQNVVVGAPVASDGEEHDDGHRDSRRISVGHQRLRQSGPRAERRRPAHGHHEQAYNHFAGERWFGPKRQKYARENQKEAQDREADGFADARGSLPGSCQLQGKIDPKDERQPTDAHDRRTAARAGIE